jgi:hypothetical protein
MSEAERQQIRASRVGQFVDKAFQGKDSTYVSGWLPMAAGEMLKLFVFELSICGRLVRR